MLEQHPYKNESVLFVDDEKYAISTVQRLFNQDFTIYTACGAEEALEILRKHSEIIVLVTDLRMPKIDGMELIRRVSNEYPAIVSILLTAYADTALIADTMREGILYQYVSKPYDAKILRQQIVQGIKWNVVTKERDICDVERMELRKEIEEIRKTKGEGLLS
ncbi:MAG: response regulator [Nitrospirae bacterium]|nr:response regulator [Candidatus Troglogloeales bacterium]